MTGEQHQMVVPEEARGSQVQHDRLLASYVKEGRKEGPPGMSGLCSRQAQPAGMGQASQGLQGPRGGVTQ